VTGLDVEAEVKEALEEKSKALNRIFEKANQTAAERMVGKTKID